jgi:hypothetical protein
MLGGNDGAESFPRRDGSGASHGFGQQGCATMQRTILLGHRDALLIPGKALQAAAIAAGQNEPPRVQPTFHCLFLDRSGAANVIGVSSSGEAPATVAALRYFASEFAVKVL